MIAKAISSLFEAIASPKRQGMSFAQGWHNLGGTMTRSGVLMDERRAETLSAVYSATRVITEGLAQLPLELRERVDSRTTEAAYNHSLYQLMHDQPNGEMTRFQFFDYQVPFQLNWGDAFAEKQRDAVTDEVIALWPIHHSRVEVVRGPYRDSYGNVLGVGRKLVYLVRGNDGTRTAHEAEDFLHVPGVMDPASSTNSGRSIPRVAAETLGIVEATQQHVASFHRNGATPDIVVAFKQTIQPEDKVTLRDSWSKTHGGVENAHKALILSGDPTVTPVSINPKDALLIDGQRFSVEEVCRFYRTPPHLLYELGRATWSNIEDMGTDFVTFTLQAWISRWEGALNTQLLSPVEQLRYFFKFNLKGLLRGNSAARMAYCQSRFNMGSMSPNEVREHEDENPVEGGDRYFIPANNLVPLDKVDEFLKSPSLPAPAAPASPAAPVDDGEVDDTGDAEPASTETGLTALIAADTPPTASTSAEQASTFTVVALRGAAQQILATTLEGLIRYESHKAALHCRKPGFDSWCESFYSGPFREAFDTNVGPLLRDTQSIGCTASLESFAASHIGESKSQLLNLYATNQETPVQAFEAKLTETLSGWTARAAEEAATAFTPTMTE